MTQHDFLESFDGNTLQTKIGAPVSSSEVERRLADAYEAGYKSGWDDAVASDKETNQRVSAEFERNIQNLNFTYNEALHRVRTELHGFLSSLVGQVLPDLTPDILRAHITSKLTEFGDGQTNETLEIRIAQNAMSVVDDMDGVGSNASIKVVEDPSLAEWQVLLNFGTSEELLDVAPLITELRDQLAAISVPDQQEDLQHA